jgi:hypothetical protein
MESPQPYLSLKAFPSFLQLGFAIIFRVFWKDYDRQRAES